VSGCWGTGLLRGVRVGVLPVLCHLNGFVVRDCLDQEKLAGSKGCCRCCVECKEGPVMCNAKHGVAACGYADAEDSCYWLRRDGRRSCGR